MDDDLGHCVLRRLKQTAGDKPLSNWLAGAGVTGGTRGSIMRGNLPSARNLLKICTHYNISLDWLLTGRGSREFRHIGLVDEMYHWSGIASEPESARDGDRAAYEAQVREDLAKEERYIDLDDYEQEAREVLRKLADLLRFNAL